MSHTLPVVPNGLQYNEKLYSDKSILIWVFIGSFSLLKRGVGESPLGMYLCHIYIMCANI